MTTKGRLKVVTSYRRSTDLNEHVHQVWRKCSNRDAGPNSHHISDFQTSNLGQDSCRSRFQKSPAGGGCPNFRKKKH